MTMQTKMNFKTSHEVKTRKTFEATSWSFGMKTIFLLIALLSVCFQSHAQIPKAFNYQCALRNADGSVMENMNVTLRLSALNGSANGPINYQERHSVNTGGFGLVNVVFGQGIVLSGSWNNIAWMDYNYFLQVEVDSGSGFVNLGAQQFISVPYALVADKAQNMTHLDLVDTEFQQGPPQDGWVIRWSGDENLWIPQPFPSIDDGVWSSDATHAWRLSGNVGLGISTPGAKLHLHSSANPSPSLKFTNASTGTSLFDGSEVRIGVNGDMQFLNWENTDMIFSNNISERMRIKANGLIGIGYSNPQNLLHLHTDVDVNTYLEFTSSSTGTGANDGVVMGLDTDNEFNLWNRENTATKFYTNNSLRMTINNDGNVGIGTAAPNTKFQINKLAAYQLRLDNTVGNYWNIGTGSAGFGTSGALMFNNTESGLYAKMVINTNGLVGIGTSTPQALLDVNGVTRTTDLVATSLANANVPDGSYRYAVVTGDGTLIEDNQQVDGDYYMTIAPSAFQPENQGVEYEINILGRLQMLEHDTRFWSPLILPNNARIMEIKFYMSDYCPDGDITFGIASQFIDGGGFHNEVSSSGSGGYQVLTLIPDYLTWVSNNSNTIKSLYIDVGGTSDPDSAVDYVLEGVRVTYNLY